MFENTVTAGQHFWTVLKDHSLTDSFALIASLSAPKMCFPSISTIHNACAHAVGPHGTILDFGTPVRHFSRNTLIPGLQENFDLYPIVLSL